MDEGKGLLKFEFPNVPKLDFASEVAEINRQVQEIAKKFTEMRMQIVESINESLAPLRDIDWEGLEQSWKKSAEELGRKGWTLPMNMTPSEIIGLSQIEEQDELDSALFDFHSNEKEYQHLKTIILEHELTNDWEKLLEQCFENYENGNYLITIPNLLIIIENIAHILISPRYQKYLKPDKRTSLRAKYKKVQREIKKDSTYIVFYVSVAEFLNKIFVFGDFDNNPTRLPMINRDWVLHGRDYPINWQQVDALRLFSALHTIVELDFLLKDLNKEEELVK
ncbi:hypothetical protein [Bacillus cereus]|uniref:hypothetical protein n=1 Tax=Bacillus cereus TaxID=1396 RepID=UPI00027C0529|nr:hypothetical protein [Bacillus cereus]EJV57008.1 hypothetical protein IEM_05059 [Bacillus cereus BAG6O-2]